MIDGTLRSTIPGANLFLLNPSGVLLGPKASLDVSGSFHVSTADFLRFADGAKFFAILGQESVLTVASPVAFGFLSEDPAGISMQGSMLQVPGGKTLSVVGGDIQIKGGTLQAPSSRINLASMTSPGEVIPSRLELEPDLQVDGFARLGRIELAQGALLATSGNGGGTVLIRGGRLMIDNAFILANNQGDVDSSGVGLDLHLTEGAVLTNGALIGSLASGAGRAGKVTVSAGESISISGHNNQGVPSGIPSFATGGPGSISLSAPTVMIDGGVIGTPSLATPGLISGRAGDISVKADNLTLIGGGLIDSSTRTDRDGGNITIAPAVFSTLRRAIWPGHPKVFKDFLRGVGVREGYIHGSRPTVYTTYAGVKAKRRSPRYIRRTAGARVGLTPSRRVGRPGSSLSDMTNRGSATQPLRPHTGHRKQVEQSTSGMDIDEDLLIPSRL